MRRIEVFADIVCPFTHVGLRRLRRRRREIGADTSLRVRAWPLEWVNGAPLEPDKAAREIEALRAAVAPELFAGFEPSTFPRTSIPAFGLAAAAYAVDDRIGEAVSLAIRDALFEGGLDVSQQAVLRDIGTGFGVVPLDPEAALAAARVDFERGKARGVRGSQHFFVGDHDWFCPSLHIRHADDHFEIDVAEAEMEDFYSAAFG